MRISCEKCALCPNACRHRRQDAGLEKLRAEVAAEHRGDLRRLAQDTQRGRAPSAPALRVAARIRGIHRGDPVAQRGTARRRRSPSGRSTSEQDDEERRAARRSGSSVSSTRSTRLEVKPGRPLTTIEQDERRPARRTR